MGLSRYFSEAKRRNEEMERLQNHGTLDDHLDKNEAVARERKTVRAGSVEKLRRAEIDELRASLSENYATFVSRHVMSPVLFQSDAEVLLQDDPGQDTEWLQYLAK